MSAGEIYSTLRKGDVCDLPIAGGKVRVVVDCAFIAFQTICIVDKHGRAYKLQPMARVRVVERAA